MSWLSSEDKNKKDQEKQTVTQRFFNACLLVLGGLIVLTLALELLAQIWVWLALAAVIVAGLWVTIRIYLARRHRW